MARIVGRQRIREGRSLGERLSEIVVYVLIVAGLVWAARWYFVVYRHSPSVVLGRYLGLVKAGDAQAQFAMLSDRSKAYFGSAKQYEEKWPHGNDLAGRVAGWEMGTVKESGDRAEIPVVLRVRPLGQALYQAASEPYNDVYVLVREAGEWKIALEQSQVKSVEAAKATRR